MRQTRVWSTPYHALVDVVRNSNALKVRDYTKHLQHPILCCNICVYVCAQWRPTTTIVHGMKLSVRCSVVCVRRVHRCLRIWAHRVRTSNSHAKVLHLAVSSSACEHQWPSTHACVQPSPACLHSTHLVSDTHSTPTIHREMQQSGVALLRARTCVCVCVCVHVCV